MLVMMRTRKQIEVDICEAEEKFLFFQKYNRLSDARLEQIKIAELKSELEANTDEVCAGAMFYE